MANTRFSTTTNPKTPSSGISELPAVLKYPGFLPFGQSIKDIYCYILKHYGHTGIAVLIYRQPANDQVIVICGDWNGNKIDLIGEEQTKLTRLANIFVVEHTLKFYELMRTIRIEQAQFFFAIDDDDLILVDVQLSLNKLASPGMVNDIFGRVFPTQQMLKTEIIDERAMEQIYKGTGRYEGDLVIKPSRFRMYEAAGQYQPFYVEMTR